MNEQSEIAKLIASRIAQPRRLTLNLAHVFTDRAFHIGGTAFGIWDSPGAADTILVRFNEVSADQIPMKRNKVIITPFNKVFITVQAAPGAGNMEILYGSGTINFFRMYPNTAEQAGAIDQIRDELVGDLLPENYGMAAVGLAAVQILAVNANRRGYDFQAALGNAGNIYIGFDNTVTAINCTAALVAGQSYSRNDYRGPLWAIASVAAQSLNYGEV